jgi:hypothetical protein
LRKPGRVGQRHQVPTHYGLIQIGRAFVGDVVQLRIQLGCQVGRCRQGYDIEIKVWPSTTDF